MKNKKYLKTAISLGVGAILLTSAVFANYENASGYSVCKNAVKKVLFAENFSVDHTINVTIDGESFAKTYGTYKVNAGGNPSLQSESTEVTPEWTYFSRRTYQDDLVIYMTQHTEMPDVKGHYYENYGEAKSIATDMTGDEKTGEKLVGFLETLSDTLIGDLKNSVVLSSDNGDVKSFNITLSKEQLPAFVNSGVSLLTSAVRSDSNITPPDEDDPYDMLFRSGEPYIKNMAANMSVDDNSNPVQITAVANVVGFDSNGEEHMLSINLSLDFYDFGTTEIERLSDEEIAEFEDYRIKAIDTKEE